MDKFLDIVKFQKLAKVLSFDEGLYESEMRDFIACFENNEGLCISVVNGKLVKIQWEEIGWVVRGTKWRVQGRKLEYEDAEPKGKVEIGVKRKFEEEVSAKGPKPVRKSQLIAETKVPKEHGQGGVHIDLDEDQASPRFTVVDFPLLPTTGLHGILHSIQESLSLLHTRIQGVEARVAKFDLQQEQILVAVKRGEAVVRENIDIVVPSFFVRPKP